MEKWYKYRVSLSNVAFEGEMFREDFVVGRDGTFESEGSCGFWRDRIESVSKPL